MSDPIRTAAALGVLAALAGGANAQEAIAPTAAAPVASQVVDKATALVSNGVAVKAAEDMSCPKVVVAPGGDTFPRKDDDYKATVEGLARDCANLGAETILKVGVVGQGARDSKNGPSWFNAPLKLSIKDASGASVETRKIKLKVTLPTGVQKVSFNHLEENVSLPQVDGGYAGWTVIVGFDPSVAASVDRPAKAARSAAVRRASRVARAAPARQAPPPAVQPAPPPPATTATASPWQKIANSFAERRAAARAEQQNLAAPPRAARGQRATSLTPTLRGAPSPMPASRAAAVAPAPAAVGAQSAAAGRIRTADGG